MKTLPSSRPAFLACLLATFLTGCLGGGVDAAHRTAARRIGVISVLGDEARGHMAGLPAVLFAGRSQASSPDFGIDAAASASAVESIQAASPGGVVTGLQAERDDVRLPGPKRAGLFVNGNVGARRQALADAARRLAARHALNLVVMIVPWEGVNGQTGQAPDEPGYGLWTLSLFGAHLGDVSVFANFAVAAFDGGTGQPLAFKLASVYGKVDDVPQRSSLDAYSPDQRARIAGAIREIVVKGTQTQLKHMNLVP